VSRQRLLIGIAMLTLAGCHGKPGTAPVSLPRLERPVLTLHGKPDEQPKIRIPRPALVERGGIPGVFVLSEAGEARFRMVRAGDVKGKQAEILSGLHGDEMLVLGDLSAVHDGSPIETVNSGKTENTHRKERKD
jgi:hypothetical protein